MKDYDNIIVWLDYYNKGLSRNKGRRLSKSLSVYDPLITELVEAAISIGYELPKDQINDSARFPRRPHIKSGYIMISKNNHLKNNILKNLGERMIQNRLKHKNK
ncbi:MAG: signal recognition particle subunit SRP19/SEC65 family protein [Candidatus Nitrosocosmicus sp.]